MITRETSFIKLPHRPIRRLTGPLERFMHVQAASGVILLLATVAALILANSELAEGFLGFWETEVEIGFGSFQMAHSLKHWINDGLMAVFFFVIGLEVKHELVLGELRDPRRAALPIAAALGGMVVPAGIYLALQWGEPAQHGWGIPMATDIAFVVGCLALLGSRVPPSLRVLLLTLAIADDIGAILVIAIGYSHGIDWLALGAGGAGIALVVVLARLGVRSIGLYTLVGAGVWFAFHASGIHATIAGVILGLLTPARSWITTGFAAETMSMASNLLTGDSAAQRVTLARAATAAREAVSPLDRLIAALHPWVSFAVMPVFALANAGVAFTLSDMGDPVAMAVALGLMIGKPVGVLGACYLAVRIGLARMPEGIGWGALTGAGVLAGIGFTMALFIAGLALDGDALDVAKVGILGGSTLCGVIGFVLLLVILPKRTDEDPAGDAGEIATSYAGGVPAE